MVPFYGLMFALFTALVVIIGDIAIKMAADRAALVSPQMILGGLLYLVSAVLWFYAMRHITLGQAGVAYSMITLIALFLIGWVGFGEPATGREIAGVGCALAAMALMSHASA